MARAESGQALVEYALITAVLVGGVFLLRNLMPGTVWTQFLQGMGVYAIYSDSFEAVLSLPFP